MQFVMRVYQMPGSPFLAEALQFCRSFEPLVHVASLCV